MLSSVGWSVFLHDVCDAAVSLWIAWCSCYFKHANRISSIEVLDQIIVGRAGLGTDASLLLIVRVSFLVMGGDFLLAGRHPALPTYVFPAGLYSWR